MAKANGTIWAVVRFDNNSEYTFSNYHVYSKTSSNFQKMQAYYEEIKNKYPTCKIILTSRRNARNGQKAYSEWYRKNFKKK